MLLPIVVRRVTGASMVPALWPGSLVIGWRWWRRLDPGSLVIVNHNGREKIKRIKTIEAGRVYVLGDNQAESTDSRHFGWLTLHDVSAKILLPKG